MSRKISAIILSVLLCGVFVLSDFQAADAATPDRLEMLKRDRIKYGQQLQRSADKPDEVLVIFEESASLSDTDAGKIKSLEEGDVLDGSIEVEDVWEFEDDGVKVALASSDELSTDVMIKKLESRDYVAAAAPNYTRRICAVNDPYYRLQWGLTGNSGSTYSGNGISVESEWARGNCGSSDAVVAVMDTGVDLKNEELKNRLWCNPDQMTLKGYHGYDFINGDTDPQDDNGHGTHCAGIIGAQSDNGKGISGIDKDISIMALKVFDCEGFGTDAEVIGAFNYIYKAMNMGVNVVAANCSFGDLGESDVMGELIDLIGQKGAVTVCAAGNDGMNVDDGSIEDSYPLCCDSPYMISVAATDSDDTLASYSNYGRNTVDIAAPGTDILSTVCDYTYTPVLYGDSLDSRGRKINVLYTSGAEDDVFDSIRTNGENAPVISSEANGGFLESAAGASSDDVIKVQFDSVKYEEGGWQYFAIPYEATDLTDDPITASASFRTEGKELSGDFFSVNAGYVIMLDLPAYYLDPENENCILGMCFEDLYDYLELDEDQYGAQIVSGKDDYWTHAVARGVDDSDEDNTDRCLLFMALCDNGPFTAYIDDIGISNSPLKDHGKYDFMSGTSMATPHVTGAAALRAVANGAGGSSYCAESTVNDILSSAEGDDLPVVTGGRLDLSETGDGFWIGINSVKVDPDAGQIIVNGGKFESEGLTDLKVTIKRSDSDEAPTEINEFAEGSNESRLIFKDEGWINNIVDITVSGTVGGRTRTASKEHIYLVDGMKKYATVPDQYLDSLSEAALATDGRNIYSAESDSDSLCVYEVGDDEFDEDTVLNFYKPDAETIFRTYRDRTPEGCYDFRFGDDLVYLDGDLYVKAAFCQVAGDAGEDDDSILGRTESAEVMNSSGGDALILADDDWDDDWDDDEEETIEGSDGPAYVEEWALLRVNSRTGDYRKIKLPSAMSKVVDYKLASYNGMLYILGGYDYSMNDGKGGFSSKVYRYNSLTGKWTEGIALPEGRIGGKVLQTGDKLVYTLGCTEDCLITGNEDHPDLEMGDKAPSNWVFDGKAWTVGKAELSPMLVGVRYYGDDSYCSYEGDVGICRDGLVYINCPACGYGDTFTYSLTSDRYRTTGYIYTNNLEDIEYASYAGAIAVDDDLYVFSEEDVQKAAGAIKSGLISITAGTYKSGKITGCRKLMPGAKYTLKAVPKAGYYTKSLKYAGRESTKGTSTDKRVTLSGRAVKSGKATASWAKYSVKLYYRSKTTLKAGKTYKIRAAITPGAAAKQRTLTYKSSNKKYASVSSKGVVKAYKAGKGKTVRITICAKGTTSPSRTLTVKIR